VALTTFKRLTTDNLVDPDPAALAFANALDPSTSCIRPMSFTDFVAVILQPTLSEAVPEDVQSVFEAGRGAMCYGYYFYPLFMIGFEQACRAAEAAVTQKVRSLGGPGQLTFNRGIDWLAQRTVIAAEDRGRWHAIRALRNQAAHPKFQQIQTPGSALEGLVTIADAISHLFSEPSKNPLNRVD
jgi:hypothetical protein